MEQQETYLEEELSTKNILDYTDACINIAYDLGSQQNVDAIIIPSRGAVPIFIGAMEALSYLAKDYKEFKEFTDKLRVSRLIKECMPESFGKSINGYCNDKNNVDVLFMPFTADLNIEKYLEITDPENKISRKYSESMRKYWPKVVSALSKGQKERERDHYLQLNLFLLKELEKREALANELNDSKWIEKKHFAMIDTVISGMACSTIWEGFEGTKIGQPTYYLIVDQNGNRLKEPYADKLQLRKWDGQNAKTLNIPNKNINAYYTNKIFSEDRGASFEGIVSIVYPSLMKAADNDPEMKKKFDSIAFGSWYSIPEQFIEERRAFDYFKNMLKAAVKEKMDGSNIQKVEENRAKFIETVVNEKLLDSRSDYANIRFAQYPFKPSRVYKAGSDVIHACFSDSDSRTLINKFKSNYKDLLDNKPQLLLNSTQRKGI
jgi:hypothetical protein